MKDGVIMNNVIIRKVNPNDAYGVEYVSAHSWKETYSGLISDEYLDNRVKKIDNKDEERINKTRTFLETAKNYYVAEYDNKIVGLLSVREAIDEYPEYGHLGAIYVLKDYQGYGIGKELFKKGIEDLIEMGYSKMQLECMKGNNTINFYKKYEGHVVDTIDYPIKDEIVKADIVLFEDINKILELLNNNPKSL